MRNSLSSIPGWSILRAFLAGFIIGPFLFGLMNGPADYQPNLVTEAMGIGFTVLVIDWLYELRSTRDLRRRLIREAGSRSNDIALSAVDELRDKEWLTGEDGLLKEVDLSNANLQGAKLIEANLQGSILTGANLRGTDCSGIDLQGATLLKAKLEGSFLIWAKLENAIFTEATLPDGERYTDNTDMGKYTDEFHKDHHIIMRIIGEKRRELGMEWLT